jgi:hypothetical protein
VSSAADDAGNSDAGHSDTAHPDAGHPDTGPAQFPAGREIAEEHDAIRSVMRWIETELRRHMESAEGERDLSAMLGPLRSFLSSLAEHFRFEEESGVLPAAILVRENPEENLRSWREQHQRILMRLNGSIRVLETATSDRPPPASFAGELRDVFADLRAHDAVENDLLGDVRSREFRGRQSSFESRGG